MVTETKIETNNIELDACRVPIIGEEIFWPASSGLWGDDKKGGGIALDMERDSYVWCFAGPRGSGKTSLMSYLAELVSFLYNKRIVSNYPIEFTVRRQDGTLEHHRSEDLDLGKLLTDDASYNGCIIVMDEAPQTINRLATMTWKNRLLTLYLQQIRKSQSSFLYGSQNERWVDGELQWQTDIECQCRDASRVYPRAGYKRGGMVLLSVKDKSGQWTGKPFNERRPVIYRGRCLTELIWGTFKTDYKLDLFESLKKVEMKLGKYQVGPHQNKGQVLTQPEENFVERAKRIFTVIKKGQVNRADLYDSIGTDDGTSKRMGRWVKKAGARACGHDKADLDFSHFDMDIFLDAALKATEND